MEPKARYTLVGISLLILVASAVYFSFWLFGSGQREKMKSYSILFRNVSLPGINSDSLVTFRGIKVGKISTVEIRKDDIEVVRLVAQIRESIPVKADTRAIVNSNLVTGAATIDLVGSTQGSPELTDVPVGLQFPVIQQGESDLQAWSKDIPETLKNISTAAREIGGATKELHTFLSAENQKAFSQILDNVSSISTDFTGKSGRIEKLFGQVDEVLSKLRATFSDLNNPNNPIGKAIIDAADVLRQETMNISSDISRMANKVGAASQTLEDPASALFGPGKNKKSVSEEVR